jgi:cyanophycinase
MNVMRALLAAACLVCAAVPVRAAAPAVTPRVGPPGGTLLIVGGGAMGGLWDVFLGLAGGRDSAIVVIPTAAATVEGEDAVLGVLRARGASKVTQLHTQDRAAADTEEFCAPLRAARGVWITGGRQWRLADAYLDTRVQRELEAVLARGGVIGGSSAGATIQGSYLVRGSPRDNRIMMSPGHERGFAFLRSSAIDQHVNTRGRAEDLRPVLRAHPSLLGVGLDESTAIIVRGDEAEVTGPGLARFFPDPESVPHVLRAGARFDLAARRPLAAAP